MGAKERVLVSACLLGVRCRYDGESQGVAWLDELLRRCEPIPVCPEQLGGLATPRTPSERVGDRVVSPEGEDVTGAFRRGADEALRLAKLYGVRCALLKARSPSCGSREIYDGSFSGRTVPGAGVAARALMDAGIEVFDESRPGAFFEHLKGNEL